MAEPAAVTPGWRKSSYSANGGAGCVEVGTWRKSSYSANGGLQCVEVGTWRKSSHSNGASANCVEVGTAVAGVLVRDTTDRAGATLSVTPTAWTTFLAAIR